jgi:broad specificity phosphatase PhoE
MTTVLFIRHGLTKENKEDRIQGQQPGTLLVPETERYMAGIIPLVRPKNPTLLFSSDLKRAIQTREMLKNFLQIPNIKESTSPLLRERAMGFYEGMIWSEVPEKFRAQRGQVTYDFRQFGGENDDDVRARVLEMLRQFAVRYSTERICCVAHAGWLQQLAVLADTQGILPDGWSNRLAIYEAGLGPIGDLRYFHPIAIAAHVDSSDD